MKEKTKHLPIVSVAILQFWTSLVFLVPGIILIFKLEGAARIIAPTILLFLFGVDFISFVLSFFLLWNKPLKFNKEGIHKKIHGNYVCFKWEDAVDIKFKILPKFDPNPWGYKYVRIIISYQNGSVLKFEPNKSITNDILSFCDDELFIKKYNEAYSKTSNFW